ncbi:MAG: cytochrome b/b6 domain-containing protein [Alphaproteobacteria bacterium]|nr:cytochrome b/b6 domain-containing protein [Alphaproteobacteria bacterium]
MSDPRKEHVLVWDIPTRIFHWTIVVLVAVSWFSADNGYLRMHLWSGLTLLALLLFRVLWGLLGSTTSRFTDFLHPPRKVMAYLRGHEKSLYAGHNPAGGWMVAVMIGVLLAQAVTGLFSNDGLHFTGPLALWVSDDVSTRITGLHGTIFNIIVVFIWLHVVAVGFYLLVKNHNLVGAMVTGKKHPHLVPAGLNLSFTRLYIALLLLALTAGIVAWVFFQGVP